MRDWQTGKPPHREIVEVEDGDGTILRVRAIWGSDGVLPHWETENGGSAYGPSAFRWWREVGGQG